jgi:hypothetical protein
MYKKGGTEMPGPDEVVYRADVFGVCHSRKCSGSKRIGTKTVYGNGDIVVRCQKCGSAADFYEKPGQDYNLGSKYGKLGEDDEE